MIAAIVLEARLQLASLVAWSTGVWPIALASLLAGCAAPPDAYPLEPQLDIEVTYRYRGSAEPWCARLTSMVGRQGWIVVDKDPRRVHLVLLEDLKMGCMR